MKKRALMLLLAVVLVVGVSFLYTSFQVDATVDGIDVEMEQLHISPKVKFMSLLYGGYYNLYNKKIDSGMTGQQALNYISPNLGDDLYDYALTLEILPQDAHFNFLAEYDKPFEYIKEEKGQGVNFKKLSNDTAKSLDTGEKVEASLIEVEPQVLIEDVINATTLRAEFSTNYGKSSSSRKNNIEIAAGYLNGNFMEGNSIMSFNDVVGERTRERGFQEADIINQGKMVPGVGGGVCQVSSTMYNASLLSGLDVVSASRHSRKVFYLPASRDAMVSSESDLVIKNPDENPVYIVTKATGENLFIAMYGKSLEYEYRIDNRVIKTIPPQADRIIVADKEKLSSEIRQALESSDQQKLNNIAYNEVRTIRSRTGIESECYLERYKDNILIDRKKISQDTYYPQQGEVIRSIK